MAYLVLGLLLWALAHLFKRIAPAARAGMGEAGKGAVAVAILAGLVLMVIGYQRAEGAFFWARHPATVGVNNLLMLLSVYLFAAAGMKTALARRMRHPMLAGVKAWALAHLLVNGDVPSFVLFGGLLAWAVIEVIVINRSEPEWTPPAAAEAPMRKEIIAVVASVALYGAISGAHYWLGYPVFG
ncbi:NnrU family protein [Roseovarius salinarum]|uniref:NnrU family protein n=1 Tax=Roseovarius salinarum TaxID=1981892 RepID=UPI000C3251C3|nr:NnrU family protein [Roseovarius salinarum]